MLIMFLTGWWSICRFAIISSTILLILAVIPLPLTLESLSTAVTILVTVGGALLAIDGVSAWKRQLHGKTDHDIAWQYLESLFKLRDAINYEVRNPAIGPAETQSAVEEFYGKDYDIEEALRENPQAENRAVYGIRWKEIIKARKEFHTSRVKAEIWWGKQVVGLDKDLNLCIGLLFSNIMSMVHPDRGLNYDHDTIYFLPEYESEFDKKLNTALGKMDAFARKYLREPDTRIL